MDLLFGLIIFFLAIYIVHKKDKRERQEKKRIAKEREDNWWLDKIKAREESRKAMQAESSRKVKKEAIRKQKEDSDQAILKAKEERKIREKLEPIQEESIARQTNVIEEIDQEVVIQWHKDIISKCQNYESNQFSFLADYKSLKIAQNFFNEYKSYDFKAYFDARFSHGFLDNYYKLQWIKDDDLNLYLVKLKNIIDGKLYLVVLTTNSASIEKDFANDPVVELEEIVMHFCDNKNITLLLEDCLLHHFKPEGVFDPFAKFDGYESIIELRHLKPALNMIGHFKNDHLDFFIALKNLETMPYKKLETIFENYHLNDSKSFNDYYVGYIAAKMTLRRGDFLDLLYELFQDNILYLNEVSSYFENELDEINRSYTLWLQDQTDVIEAHVYKVLNTYENSTRWQEGLYFSSNHPLGLGFKAEKKIVLLPYKGKIKYKTMHSDSGLDL